mmetsp:Transcript_25253/g.79238  ORF Transcript_25253/g.79238 Transcript_25253/m.79238 type:complete len:358 (-) Transcript_25253:360-1433(-)
MPTHQPEPRPPHSQYQLKLASQLNLLLPLCLLLFFVFHSFSCGVHLLARALVAVGVPRARRIRRREDSARAARWRPLAPGLLGRGLGVALVAQRLHAAALALHVRRELHDERRHVVLAALLEAVVQQLLAAYLEVRLSELLHELAHVGHPLRGRHDIPDAVAGEQQIVVRGPVPLLDDEVRVGRHALRLRRQLEVLLELKVAKGAAHSEVPIHAPHGHVAAGALDTLLLLGVVRLVVLAEVPRAVFAHVYAHDAARIARIRAHDVRRRNDAGHPRGPALVARAVLVLRLTQLLVGLQEAPLERSLERFEVGATAPHGRLVFLKVLLDADPVEQVRRYPLAAVLAPMPVEHANEVVPR